MGNQVRVKVQDIVATMDIPPQVEPAQLEEVLFIYTIADSEALEKIEFETDASGNVAAGKTEKVSNLRFRLGELIVEVIKSGGALYGVKLVPVLWIPIIVDFAKKAKDLSKLEFGNKEAQILLLLYQLKMENDPLTMDNLNSLVDDKLTDRELQQALHALQQLGCLSLGTDGIVLHETLDV